jgi:hypothetical protein
VEVKILLEGGYEEALIGMSLSYYKGDGDLFEWFNDRYERQEHLAKTLCNKDGGHNKFLESIQVWMLIRASRAFWQEFDTYRVGITKQSESTMHTLSKRAPTFDDFEQGTPIRIIEQFMNNWFDYKDDLIALKHCLPEGFLQRRVVCTNYKSLRNIIRQRQGHRYRFWDAFITQLMNQAENWELLR